MKELKQIDKTERVFHKVLCISSQCVNHKRQCLDWDYGFRFCQEEFHKRAAPYGTGTTTRLCLNPRHLIFLMHLNSGTFLFDIVPEVFCFCLE